jgi:hypothetical protein
LDAILNDIKVNFHSLNEDLKADQILERNTHLKEFIDPAQTQFQQLQAAIAAHPTAFEVIQFIGPCITALDDLGGGPPEGPIDFAWNMNFDWQVYWTDAGQYFVQDVQGHTIDVGYKLQAPQPNPDGVTVFVYTYSLPLYLYAVAIFLAVAGALDPNFIANYGDTVLRLAAALLRSKYEKITQDGLKSLSPYDWTEDPEGAPTLGAPGWRRDGEADVIEYGAVEKFSGYSSIGGNYRLDPKPSHTVEEISAIFKKLQLRVLKRTKDVYVGVGLSRVWGVINKLNALVGDALLPYPNFANWSLRECVRVMKLDSPGITYYDSLRNLAQFIITTQRHDTPYPVDPPWPSISIRALLTNFNDD